MVGQLFSRESQAIFYNWKANPVQRMLDFDFLCGAPLLPSALALLTGLTQQRDAVGGAHPAA